MHLFLQKQKQQQRSDPSGMFPPNKILVAHLSTTLVYSKSELTEELFGHRSQFFKSHELKVSETLFLILGLWPSPGDFKSKKFASLCTEESQILTEANFHNSEHT